MTQHRSGTASPAWLTALAAAAAIALIPLGAPVAANDPSPAVLAQASPSGTPASGQLVYRPPLRGAPATRVAGGTRGDTGEPAVAVLVPEHTGLTISEQPTLYWYLGQPTAMPVEVTLIDEQAVEPLLEIDARSATQAGINTLDLARHDVRLEPDTEYRWSVALIRDPMERSSDVIASGTIRRIMPDAVLSAKLADADALDRLRILAAAGIWYDAVETVSKLIEGSPADPRYRRLRAALLDQVSLPAVAAHDMRQRR